MASIRRAPYGAFFLRIFRERQRLNLVILYQIIVENAWKCAKEDDIIIIDFCVQGGDDYG